MQMKYHKADEGYKIVHSNGQERTPKPEFFVFFSLLDERLLVGEQSILRMKMTSRMIQLWRLVEMS